MADIIITGGLVVTPMGTAELDVSITGESISAVSEPGTVERGNARVIDASGKIVVPGGIEPHAHIGGAAPAGAVGGGAGVESRRMGRNDDGVGLRHAGARA